MVDHHGGVAVVDGTGDGVGAAGPAGACETVCMGMRYGRRAK
jgi:hypothetical protein